MSREDSSQQLKGTLCTISMWPATSSSTRVAHGCPFCGSAGSAAESYLGKVQEGNAKAP